MRKEMIKLEVGKEYLITGKKTLDFWREVDEKAFTKCLTVFCFWDEGGLRWSSEELTNPTIWIAWH